MLSSRSRDETTTRALARQRLGFKEGKSGAHAARTMMLADITMLFDRVPPDARRGDYRVAIVEANDLGKPSLSARKLAFELLVNLYTLDPGIPLFRCLRKLWSRDERARPLLALTMAIARDPLLRVTQPWLLAHAEGALVTWVALEAFLATTFPDRFSPVMLTGLAHRINGTWTQSGHLTGRARKRRTRIEATPTNLAFNLFLGYLEGASGQ